MKKTILTAMLFFAFLLVGVQNASAQTDVAPQTTTTQNYTNSSQAMSLLLVEIQNVENDPLYSGNQTQHPTYSDLVLRLNYYIAVYEGLLIGEEVSTAIQIGVDESDATDKEMTEIIDPTKQQVEQLLSL